LLVREPGIGRAFVYLGLLPEVGEPLRLILEQEPLEDAADDLLLVGSELGDGLELKPKAVGGSAGETDQNLPLAGALDLAGSGLENGLAESDLAVAGHADLAAAADQ